MGWLRGKNADGGEGDVPRAWAADLERMVAPLKDRALASAVCDYVLRDSDVQNLRKLAHQQTYDSGYRDPQALLALTSRLRDVPFAVAVRFAFAVTLMRHDHPVSGYHPLLVQVAWLQGLLIEVSESITQDQRHSTAPIPVDLSLAEDLLAATGHPRHLVLVAAFSTSGHPWYYPHEQLRRTVLRMQGYDAAVRRHTEHLRPTLQAAKVDDRLVALEMLAPLPADVVSGFALELATCLTANSVKVAKAAHDLLDRSWPAVQEPLVAIAGDGSPPERAKALDLLWASADPELRTWCEERAAGDRASSVRDLLAQWRAQSAPAVAEEVAPRPERPTINWRTTVDPHVRASLREAVRRSNRDIDRYQRHHGRSEHYDERLFDHVLDDLTAGRIPTMTGSQADPEYDDLLEYRVNSSDTLAVGFPGIIAVMAAGGMLLDGYHGLLGHHAASLLTDHFEKTGTATPLELATAMDELGLPGGTAVLRSWGREWGGYGDGFPAEAWAPFVLAHLDLVVAELQRTERDYWIEPDLGFRALATLPELPGHVIDVLFDLALGPRKTARRPSQDLLAAAPGVLDRAVGALADRKAEVRSEAASWLGRARHEAALEPLESAVRKERNDLAMGAMLDALEALGQPVERYLDRDDLLAQAEKAVAKGLPAALSWFPWTGLPDVRWAHTGEPVDRVVLQWMLANAVKGKTAEPNAVLRKYCAMFDPRDREALGQYVLEVWIAEDIRPIATDEAEQRAAQEAFHLHQYIQQYPQAQASQNSPFVGATLEQVTAALLPRHLRTPAGSAAASKGVLAVAAACTGGGAAPVAQRYLKEWYGQRAAQGRALIQMLAWIDHPTATQLVLSVGSRFRTKSFQEEATRQAEALAERKGWSMGELADRTIPSAGFDESGLLELSYGDRVFTARLMPDLTLVLTSPEGKTVRSLPTPRQTDDADRVKESKKALTATKKELKSVVETQTERLYEALCTGRTWSTDVWTTYLNEHPVVRHLTRRLAWAATAADGSVTVFRPLDDGSLTDVEDEPVEIHPGDTVAVAHDSVVPEDVAAAWLEHFADYEVTPLFQQFGKARFELPEAMRTERSITDHEGHLVEAFKLRGRANKLGYVRGPAEDAGIFSTYEKRFPTLALTAVVDFSGNSLPEENRAVALHGLRFRRFAGGRAAGDVPLGEVPAVLLSEVYTDVASIAAAGTGFDPDWEKKVEW